MKQKVLLPNGRLVPFAKFLRGNTKARKPFIWVTHKGEYLLVTRMATDHIFNSIRMLWNHGVPPAFRVGKFRRWPDVFNWATSYKDAAMDALLDEFDKRNDAHCEDLAELADMARNAEVLEPLLQLAGL